MAGEQNLSILPYNRDATEEEELYSFQTYIPSNIRNAVSEAAQVNYSTQSKIKGHSGNAWCALLGKHRSLGGKKLLKE